MTQIKNIRQPSEVSDEDLEDIEISKIDQKHHDDIFKP